MMSLENPEQIVSIAQLKVRNHCSSCQTLVSSEGLATESGNFGHHSLLASELLLIDSH